MSMLTSSRVTGVVLFSLTACLPGSRMDAFEGTDGATVEQAPLRTFTTPQAGLEGFRSGDTASAIEELKYAASGGEPPAQWKLAKIIPTATGFRTTISKLTIIFLKSPRITTKTTRTSATSPSCRAPLSRLEFMI
jgi:hypothetical protein